jgi:hypothetical protein
MARTRTDLVNKALYNLGVTPSGQTPGIEEYNTVNDLVDGVIEDLIERDIYYLVDVDAVPVAPFIHIAHILAYVAAPEFGAAGDASLAAKAQKAEMDLQAYAATRPTYQPLKVQAF